MAQQHQAEVNRLQQQIKDLQQQLGSKDSQINELTIGSNFSRSAYIAEELTLTLVMRAYMAHTLEMKMEKLD
ncbi:hypothetical protein [Acinetobacter baumannii]|uniref:hypothetical protein n=1 Tax=Acinetobacter baumannii TaxID=470 RepID=UPI00294A93FA|nr:hypothetical protein [Acinetobacter baumannii]MDV5203724.1 hypothetical protein [Acinetobacter baumannii]